MCKKLCEEERKIRELKFINRGKETHKKENGEPKYGYEHVIFINGTTKVIIFCPIHGFYELRPIDHTYAKMYCPSCTKESRTFTTEEYINKVKKIYLNLDGSPKYGYIKTIYINSRTKIIVTCSEHGDFLISPNIHLNRGGGCPKCSNERGAILNSLTTEEFIYKAQLIHINPDGSFKFDYSLVIYKNGKTKVIIKCNSCGLTFSQIPANHLSGSGCPHCNNLLRFINRRKTLEQFIIDAIKVHGDKYDYSLVIYINTRTKVLIKCNKCGKIFSQTPQNHLHYGLLCKHELISEPRLFNKIKEVFNNEMVISQGNPPWLKSKTNYQYIDIYFLEWNIGIEYQGAQHFKPIKLYGNEKGFKYAQERDERKRDKCLKNNCKLLYFTYRSKDIPINYPHKVFTDEQELIDEINKLIIEQRELVLH